MTIEIMIIINFLKIFSGAVIDASSSAPKTTEARKKLLSQILTRDKEIYHH
jgi:hypothetical protein